MIKTILSSKSIHVGIAFLTQKYYNRFKKIKNHDLDFQIQ